MLFVEIAESDATRHYQIQYMAELLSSDTLYVPTGLFRQDGGENQVKQKRTIIDS